MKKAVAYAYLENEKRGNKSKVAVMVPVPIVERYETIATKTGHTFSQVVRAAMAKFIDDLDELEPSDKPTKRRGYKLPKQMSFIEDPHVRSHWK